MRSNVNTILDNSFRTLIISMMSCKNTKEVGTGKYYIKPLRILNEYSNFFSFGSIFCCQQSSFAMPVRLKIHYKQNPKCILTPLAATYVTFCHLFLFLFVIFYFILFYFIFLYILKSGICQRSRIILALNCA
jgi:hypothetical protein